MWTVRSEICSRRPIPAAVEPVDSWASTSRSRRVSGLGVLTVPIDRAALEAASVPGTDLLSAGTESRGQSASTRIWVTYQAALTPAVTLTSLSHAYAFGRIATYTRTVWPAGKAALV